MDLGHLAAAGTTDVVFAVGQSHFLCIVFRHQGVAARRGLEQGLKGFDLSVGAARVVITGLVVSLPIFTVVASAVVLGGPLLIKNGNLVLVHFASNFHLRKNINHLRQSISISFALPPSDKSR